MAVISIDWATKVISVPRDYMTLIQSTPIEIRELNINQFRLDLKALEASEEGAVFPDTHRHNTEVLLGGIIYARVVEIINGYTVTFEDGSYAVNLIGANSNIGDVVNLNMVSVRSNNAAGLISNAAIEFASFGGGVTIDVTSPYAGTVFPTGTPQKPVNNWADAKLIADTRGLRKFFVKGDLTIEDGFDADGYAFAGESMFRTTITIEAGSNVASTEFSNCTVVGFIDGQSDFRDCRIMNIAYFAGLMENCMLCGDITLIGDDTASFRNCYDGLPGLGTPTIDGGTGTQDIGIWGYFGGLKIQNITNPIAISVNLATGRLVLDPTVVNGDILVKGVGLIEDNSTGTAVVNSDGIVSNAGVADSVWEEPLSGHSPEDSAANMIKRILGLSHENFRVLNGAHDGDGNLISADIKVYPSRADADANTNSIATYAMTATFSGPGKMTSYKQVKTS